MCENLNCPAQKTRRLEYFAKRGALEIDGIGGIVADKLVERGLVREPLDLFSLAQDRGKFLEALATFESRHGHRNRASSAKRMGPK